MGRWVTLSVMEGVLTPPLPEGRLDTLHDSLYLYLSLLLRSLAAPGFAPSLPANIPPFSFCQRPCPPSHSLRLPLVLPSELQRATAVNRSRELRQDQSCNVQMDLFVHSAGMLTGYSTEDFNLFRPLQLTGQPVKYHHIMTPCKDENTWLPCGWRIFKT